MIIHKLVVGEISTNCYLLSDEVSGLTVIVDPGDEADKIAAFIVKNQLQPLLIINTHAHPDHVGANAYLKQQFKVPIYLHRADKFLFDSGKLVFSLLRYNFEIGYPDEYVVDGQEIVFGKNKLIVLHTPGHSPGSICLYDGYHKLFSGDTLFAKDVGRTDLPGGSSEAMACSIKKLLGRLPLPTVIYPGHGRQTTLQSEKKNLEIELGGN